MLDQRLEDFDEQARFLSMLIGLLSVTERVARLAELESSAQGVAVDDTLLNVALGALSLRRTLHDALLTSATPNVAPSSLDSSGTADTSWLR